MYPEVAGVGLYYPVNALGILLNATLLFALLWRDQLPTRGVLLYLVIHAFFGILGAKLYDVLMRGWLGDLSFELAGGYRYPGALVGLLCAAVWFRRLLPQGLTVPRFFDYWIPGFALALAVGRMACFLHGCCHGAVCGLPWAVRYPSESIAWFKTFEDTAAGWTEWSSAPVHPLPLYSMTLELTLFALCLWLLPRKRFDGQVFLIFLAIHGPVKSAIEFLRFDYHPLHQAVFLIGLVAAGLLAYLWTRETHQQHRATSETSA